MKRKALPTKTGSVADLIEELVVEVLFLAQHLFRADWQHRQFKASKEKLKHGTVCMVLDFAENYTCTFQNEVQAAHWNHQQVTLHPIVTYYPCPQPDCSDTMMESVVLISDDLKHDHYAVRCFEQTTLQHLRSVRGLNIEHVVEWSDGCSSQYKSRGPFSSIAASIEDLNATLERNYFGSRHGKGPSDGESAVVKHHAATAVKAGSAVIATPEDLMEYCTATSLNKQPSGDKCQHFLRSFYFVSEQSVEATRVNNNLVTVPGTRTFHSVRCAERGQILTRHLSCFCDSCQSGVGRCQFSEIVSDWAVHFISGRGRQNQKRKRTQAVGGRKRHREDEVQLQVQSCHFFNVLNSILECISLL